MNVTATCRTGVNRRLHFTQRTVECQTNVTGYTDIQLQNQAVAQAVDQSMELARRAYYTPQTEDHFDVVITFKP